MFFSDEITCGDIVIPVQQQNISCPSPLPSRSPTLVGKGVCVCEGVGGGRADSLFCGALGASCAGAFPTVRACGPGAGPR